MGFEKMVRVYIFASFISSTLVAILPYVLCVLESSRFWSFFIRTARKDTSSSFTPAWTLLLVNKLAVLFSLLFPSPPGPADFSCRVFRHRSLSDGHLCAFGNFRIKLEVRDSRREDEIGRGDRKRKRERSDNRYIIRIYISHIP